MCDESSSVLVGNTADSGFVNEAGNEVDPENAEDEYRIDGMDDIGRVRFDLFNGDEVCKYHFADNGTGYEFYNTYANGTAYVLTFGTHFVADDKTCYHTIHSNARNYFPQEAVQLTNTIQKKLNVSSTQLLYQSTPFQAAILFVSGPLVDQMLTNRNVFAYKYSPIVFGK
ncbi:hypothetical protein RIF29_21314 [Crotalaria pallida]|uniref:Uncharacterized protein n=1 Tax=Crotalaria pallida TaxID=3830 RepID=A0AAN9I738_CROPI